MGEFYIRIRSLQDIQDFVALSTAQPFRVQLGNEYPFANATSFMALVSLDYRRPIRVTAHCSEAEFSEFRKQAARFAAE